MHLNSLEEVGQKYRHIYLSPHYDDAVLSCGGTIGLQKLVGSTALVVTIFGGSGQDASLTPLAAELQQRGGTGQNPADYVARRREEDASACDLLGADTLWLEFPDAIYRGYTSREALFGQVTRTDLAIEEQVAALALEIHSRAPLAVIYAPLGVGHHVDHQIVTSAADRLVQQRANIKFYEDFPYIATAGALEARQRELQLKMEPEYVEMSAQLQQKIEAVSVYRSQIAELFGTEEKLRQMIESYHGNIRTRYPGIKIERYWHW